MSGDHPLYLGRFRWTRHRRWQERSCFLFKEFGPHVVSSSSNYQLLLITTGAEESEKEAPRTNFKMSNS